jgi:transcriptional regulator with XRE-family HTH domain
MIYTQSVYKMGLMAGKSRIGPKRPRRIFLQEWREFRGLTQEQLGERLEPPVANMTVSRWERATRGGSGQVAQMNAGVLAAVAEALDIEPQDLYRHPNQPSADEMLRGSSESVQNQAFRVIEALVGKKAAKG